MAYFYQNYFRDSQEASSTVEGHNGLEGSDPFGEVDLAKDPKFYDVIREDPISHGLLQVGTM